MVRRWAVPASRPQRMLARRVGASVVERPERDLRSITAVSPALALPFVGVAIAILVAGGAVFSVLLALAGPPRVGLAVAAVALPLAVLILRPARLSLRADSLEWRWWWWPRSIPLASIERVEASPERLRLWLRDGTSRELPVRWSTHHPTGLITERRAMHLQSFAAFIQARATRAS